MCNIILTDIDNDGQSVNTAPAKACLESGKESSKAAGSSSLPASSSRNSGQFQTSNPSQKRPPVMTMSERIREMYALMSEIGIARSNAIFHSCEYAKKAKDAEAFSSRQRMVISAFLNSGFNFKTVIDMASVKAHRIRMKRTLLTDVGDNIIDKKSLFNLVEMLTELSIDYDELKNAVNALRAELESKRIAQSQK